MEWNAIAIECCVALGHMVVWVAIFNRMHATGIPRWLKKIGERTIYVLLLGIGLMVLGSDLARAAAGSAAASSAAMGSEAARSATSGDSFWVPMILGGSVPAWFIDPSWVRVFDFYRSLCLIAAAAVVLRWLFWLVMLRRPVEFRLLSRVWHRLRNGTTTALIQESDAFSNERLLVEREPAEVGTWCGDPLTRMLASMPMNQILEVEVNQKELRMAGLPAAFDGLSIVHLSDFHLTGRMSRAYYERVIELASSLEGEVAVVTGDIVDYAHCLDWLNPIFAPLRVSGERMFILGNHDKRIKDDREIRSRMVASGWRDVAGAWHAQQRGEGTIWWSGNELPWYHGAASLKRRARQPGELRILLSHAPDQIDFACSYDFDLVLAGHTHGGQIRPPLIGPIVSPSHYGPKYASGEFRVGSTWMHVSRGIAGTHPLRINCAPEITRLVIRRG